MPRHYYQIDVTVRFSKRADTKWLNKVLESKNHNKFDTEKCSKNIDDIDLMVDKYGCWSFPDNTDYLEQQGIERPQDVVNKELGERV